MAEVRRDRFTKVPHALLHALAATKLPARHLQVMLWLMRETFGFHRPDGHYIGAAQIAYAIGIKDVSNVRKALRDLTDWGLIERVGRADGRGYKPFVRVVTDIAAWKREPRAKLHRGELHVPEGDEDDPLAGEGGEADPLSCRGREPAETTRPPVSSDPPPGPPIPPEEGTSVPAVRDMRDSSERNHTDRDGSGDPSRSSSMPVVGGLDPDKVETLLDDLAECDGTDEQKVTFLRVFAPETRFGLDFLADPDHTRDWYARWLEEHDIQTEPLASEADPAGFAVTMLGVLLRDCAMPSAELEERMKQAGVSEWHYKQARSVLRVECYRERSGGRRWLSWLPDTVAEGEI